MHVWVVGIFQDGKQVVFLNWLDVVEAAVDNTEQKNKKLYWYSNIATVKNIIWRVPIQLIQCYVKQENAEICIFVHSTIHSKLQVKLKFPLRFLMSYKAQFWYWKTGTDPGCCKGGVTIIKKIIQIISINFYQKALLLTKNKLYVHMYGLYNETPWLHTGTSSQSSSIFRLWKIMTTFT